MRDGSDGFSEGYGPEWQTDPDRGSGGGGSSFGGCLIYIIIIVVTIILALIFGSGSGKSSGHTYYDPEYPYERDYPEPNYPAPPPDYYENWDYPEPDYPEPNW
jgi:hypothetical protein